MNKSKGNMYDFVTHTWNPIKGRCPHQCEYCYMKKWGEQPPLYLAEKELRKDMGHRRFYFVGSGTDMWADGVPEEWIKAAISHCSKYEDNTYLFQSKNPERYIRYFSDSNKPLNNFVFGTTIETNRNYPLMGNAPTPDKRALHLLEFSAAYRTRSMVTIEPIIDFDLEELLLYVRITEPEWVNIGADSKGHDLPEPSSEKIETLIQKLGKFTEVRLKSNLKRLNC